MDVQEDIVLEILSRFPLEQVGKVQALSKFYNKASYHSYYRALVFQRQRGLILDGFLLQTLKSNANILSFVSPRSNDNSRLLDLTLSFLPGRNPQIRAVAPNGLLLCETRHPSRYNKCFYTITKLSTKRWKGLPIPKTRFFTQNIAIYILSSNPLHFKILRLSQDQIPSKRPLPFCYTICEVFDSVSWRWKQLDDIVQDYNSGSVESHRAPVFAYGSAHWKFSNETSLFTFDFYSQTWSKIALPDTIINEYEDIRKSDGFQRWRTELVEYEGKLGLMREFYGPPALTELWVMEKSNHKGIWTKKFDFLGSMPMTLYGSDILVKWLHNKSVMFSSTETEECNCKKLDFASWNFDPPPRSLNPKTAAKIQL